MTEGKSNLRREWIEPILENNFSRKYRGDVCSIISTFIGHSFPRRYTYVVNALCPRGEPQGKSILGLKSIFHSLLPNRPFIRVRFGSEVERLFPAFCTHNDKTISAALKQQIMRREC
jgi:hypothetical protein